MISWSQIVSKNIKMGEEIDLLEKDQYVQIQRDNVCNDNNSVIYINDRNVPSTIKETSTNYSKENNKKFYRKRNIPTKKPKNYQTKPKKDSQVDIKNKKFDDYNYINNFGNDPNVDFDYVGWMETAIDSKNNNDDSGILGALLVDKENNMQITFLDSITSEYVIEPYEMPKEGIESYVWIPPVEYINPEIHYDIIWKKLDYEFYKKKRPYIYNSPLEGGPNIKFYNLPSL